MSMSGIEFGGCIGLPPLAYPRQISPTSASANSSGDVLPNISQFGMMNLESYMALVN